MHVIDFARCLLGGASCHIPPTLPRWRVGCDATLIERKGGLDFVLNDTARFPMRSAENCQHRQVHRLERPQRATIRILVSQNDDQTATEPAWLTVHGKLRTYETGLNQFDRQER